MYICAVYKTYRRATWQCIISTILNTYPNECLLHQHKYQLLFEYFHNITTTDSIIPPIHLHILLYTTCTTVIILYRAYCSRVSLGTKQTDDSCINTRLSNKLLTIHMPACMHSLPPYSTKSPIQFHPAEHQRSVDSSKTLP